MQNMYTSQLKPSQYPDIHLDINPYCNARCEFCGYHGMTRKKSPMKKQLFTKIIDEISLWETNKVGNGIEIVPTFYGEFFLNPEWKRYLSYISDNLPKCRIAIPTNGSRITPETIEFLAGIPNLTYMNFSIYYTSPEEYEKRIGLPRETMTTSLEMARQLRKLRPDIKVIVGTTNDPRFCTNPDQNIRILEEQWGESDVGVHPITRNHSHGGYVRPYPSCTPCASLFVRTFILNDGRVTTCCFDPNAEIIYGDVNRDSIYDIWHGVTANAIRTAHAEGRRDEIPICKSCDQFAWR